MQLRTRQSSLHSSSSKQRLTRLSTVRHPLVTCAAGSDKHHGWHWPFSKHTADDVETEIVYVTDTAEADEVIEEPDYVDVDQDSAQQQSVSALGGVGEATAAAAPRETAGAAFSNDASPSIVRQQQADDDFQVRTVECDVALLWFQLSPLGICHQQCQAGTVCSQDVL